MTTLYQSDIASLSAAARMETAECPQCEGTIRQEDIVITARGRRLGGNNNQTIEAHCRHCRIMVTFDREFTGAVWQRVGKVKVLTEAQQTAAQQRRRSDLDHAIRLEQDESEPGRDYME